MNVKSILLGAVLASSSLFAANRTEPVNLYVSENGDWNPEGSEYSYTTIQEAVAAATVAGDVVWVDDGFVCDSGECAPVDTLTGSNRVAVTKAITLRSKSGYVDESDPDHIKGAYIRGKYHSEERPCYSGALRLVGAERRGARERVRARLGLLRGEVLRNDDLGSLRTEEEQRYT